MPTIEITEEHQNRIETLRAELSANHAGAYATVEDGDVLAYLLDLAEAVEDPNREAAVADQGNGSDRSGAEGDASTGETDGEGADREDGASDIQNEGTEDGARGDHAETGAEADDAEPEEETAAEADEAEPDENDADTDDSGGEDQLNAMLNLVETHADKWRAGDGDARYEVDLPDGGTEQARTKDDVRALLFKHYR